MRSLISGLACVLALFAAGPAGAWGNDGHKQTGFIAESALSASAKTHVHALLGYDLATAALWADCAKSFKPSGASFAWRPKRGSTACAPFETAPEQALMKAYVARNWKSCGLSQSCHNKYHFADIATGHDGFDPGYFGAPPYNIVAAVNAAITYLKTGQSTAPVSIASKKEAVLLLAHLLGDLHQPLHVGAVYLTPAGHIVPIRNPETYAEAMETEGGNLLFLGSQPLHGYWDTVLSRYGAKAADDVLAVQVADTVGPMDGWAASWANDTFSEAQKAYGPLTYGAVKSFDGPYGPVDGWPAYFQPGEDYGGLRRTTQTDQLAKGGHRLAQLLNALDAQGALNV